MSSVVCCISHSAFPAAAVAYVHVRRRSTWSMLATPRFFFELAMASFARRKTIPHDICIASQCRRLCVCSTHATGVGRWPGRAETPVRTCRKCAKRRCVGPKKLKPVVRAKTTKRSLKPKPKMMERKAGIMKRKDKWGPVCMFPFLRSTGTALGHTTSFFIVFSRHFYVFCYLLFFSYEYVIFFFPFCFSYIVFYFIFVFSFRTFAFNFFCFLTTLFLFIFLPSFLVRTHNFFYLFRRGRLDRLLPVVPFQHASVEAKKPRTGPTRFRGLPLLCLGYLQRKHGCERGRSSM